MNPLLYRCPTCDSAVDDSCRCWNRACPDWGIERFWPPKPLPPTVAKEAK